VELEAGVRVMKQVRNQYTPLCVRN